MNSKLVVLILFTFNFLNVTGQFTWSNPHPSGFINTKVVLTSESIGYIINDNGDFITTINGGTTWKVQQNFPNCKTMDVLDSVIVIGGADTIYLSTDKGQSWKKSSINTINSINNIQIISEDTIFIVGNNPNLGVTELFQSVDQGRTWSLINNSFIIKSVDFTNSKLGYATSYGGIFKTIDGGKSWQNVYRQGSGYSFTTIKFRDQNNGFAFQDLGQLFKTIDGGVTWSVSTSNLAFNIYSISFANGSAIFIAGELGLIYRSLDNGDSWEYKGPDNTGDGYGLYSMSFANSNLGLAVGMRGQILRTTDLGDTYKGYAPNYVDIKPLSFPTDSVGYAASWNELFKTKDAGKSWVKLPFGLSIPPYGLNRWQYLHFFSEDTGIALAESPVQLYKTYDGGQSWKPLTLSLLYKDHINGFFFLRNTGYLNIEGAYGSTMMKSKDLGETWQIQSTQYQGDYQNLHFVDERVGYGNIGPTLYKTYDSAKTWEAVMNNTDIINGIWFVDPSTGYIVGEDGYNQKSTDSGKTWNRLEILPDNFNFDNAYAIKFFNKKVGYLVSAMGGVYRTYDEGKNWKAERLIPGECKSIEMTSDTSVYIAGTYGFILKKDMREYSIDSLKVTSESSCSARVSASVTAVLSAIDSVWFEYGTTGFTKTIPGTPLRVLDTSQKVESPLEDLHADSLNMVRVKILYRGNYYYSAPVNFQLTGVAAPIITSLDDTALVSSASSYYQWYFNNIKLIADTSKSIRITANGFYRVETSPNKVCWKASIDYPVLAIGNTLSDSIKVQVYPNPAAKMFNLVITLPAITNVVVSVTIVSTAGNIVLQTEKLFFYSNQVKIPLILNTAGVYNIRVTINGEVKTQTVIIQ